MKHTIRQIFPILLAASLSIPAALPADKSWKEDLKKKKAAAQELIAEAKKAEAGGDLKTAEANFNSAANISPSKEAASGATRVHQKRLENLMGDAGKLYQSSNYAQAIAKLKEADELQPKSPRILQSLAASYYKLGDGASALDYLDQCKNALPAESAERTHIDQYRAMVITGDKTELQPEAKAAVINVNMVLTAKPPHGEEIKDYRSFETEQEGAKCKALIDNESRLPKSGPVIFNLAKCAQEEGRFEDANRYFAHYLEIAPKSLDGEDIQLRIKDIEPLLALNGEKAKQLQNLYTEAYRLILVRKYGQALEIYKKGDLLFPDYAQTKYKIGSLYRSMGNTAEASSYLRQYMAVEDNGEARKRASDIIDTLAASKSEYDAHIAAGKRILLTGQIAPAVAELSKAELIFPLGSEVNSLLAQAYLNGNNPPAARVAMDTVFSQNAPVYFYATVASSARPAPEGKVAVKGPSPSSRSFPARQAKIELETDRVRVIFLQSVNPEYLEAIQHKHKKGEALPAVFVPSAAGLLDDKQARIDGSSRTIVADNAPDVFTIPLAQIKEIATQGESVSVSFAGAAGNSGVALEHLLGADGASYAGKTVTLRFTPQVSAFTPPDTGWPARKFANTYTRMFSQYLGFDGVKLGPEHMSAKEKWMIVAAIALIVASEGQAMNSMSKTLMVAFMAVQAFSRIQASILTDRRLAQNLDFKIIPPEPMELAFRADDFK